MRASDLLPLLWAPAVLAGLALQAAEAPRVAMPLPVHRAAASSSGACALGMRSGAAVAALTVERDNKRTGARPASMTYAAVTGELSVVQHGTSGERPDRCERVLPLRRSFSIGEREIYQRTTVAGLAAGDMVRWEWLQPDGSLFKAGQLITGFSGGGCVWDGLALTNDAALLPGDWQVRVLVNQKVVTVDRFAIGAAVEAGAVDASGRLSRQILNAHFTGLIRLGFAVMRAGCTGPNPVTGDVLAFMRDDLTALENTMSLSSAVIPFDLGRIRAVRDGLDGMTGDAALVVVNQLFGDILTAVQQARVSCQAGTGPLLAPPVWVGVTLAGYRLGITVALAVCFYCDQPIPDEYAAYIRSQLEAARSDLSPYANCLQGFNFNQFSTPRLGAPASSQASHLDLTALYEAIQMAILSNDCTCDNESVVSATAATVQGTVRNASNGQPLAGATVTVVGTSLGATTGADGSFTLNNVPAGPQTLRASATGFLSADVALTVTGGQTLTQNLSLSPVLQSGELRMTLNWTRDASRRPNDLDTHLTGPHPDGSSCFHVYYSNQGSLTAAPFALLEVDNINAAGDPPAETIRLSRLTPGIYRLYIHNYSGETADGLAQSRATVQIVGSGGQVFSQSVPSGTGNYWTVFTLNGQTGAVTGVNQLAGSAPSPSPCR